MLTAIAFLVGIFLVVLGLGVITLNPDRTTLRLTTDNTPPNNGQQLQTSIANQALTNPGPMMVATTQNNAAGNVLVQPAAGSNGANNYWGYNVRITTPNGEPCEIYKGVTVEGFLGCTPGSAVYVDATSAEAGGNASGLSHTANGTRIGVALSATRIRFD